MMLRVAINATPLLAPLTGIGHYIVELGAALAATREVDLYSFYGFRWRHERPQPDRADAVRKAQRMRDVVKPFIPFKRELRHAQQRSTFARGLRSHAIGLYHEPNYVPLRYEVPVVLTIHDLSWLRYPETHPPDRVRWLDRGMPIALARAAAILVDSAFVRKEVLSTFAIDPDRVHTAALGVSPIFHPRNAAETRAALQPLDLAHGEYILTVGTIEPRKNLRHVLTAYAQLPESTRRRFPLVIAGARGWRASGLERELDVLVEKGSIRFLGYVADDVMPHLYAGAVAFVFASLYEGFGLPPLEAMASGVPTLVTNRSSLPEIAGDAAVFIDPELPDDTARKLAALLEDGAFGEELSRRGVERAARFTWRKCAEATLGAYHAASAR